MNIKNQIKYLEKEIIILENKSKNIFNPNMISILEELYLKRYHLYFIKNNIKYLK